MSLPAPELCTRCAQFRDRPTLPPPWCADDKYGGEITEPEPRCKGYAFRERGADEA